MSITSFEHALPVDFQNQGLTSYASAGQEVDIATPTGKSLHDFESEVASYVVTWKNQIRNNRISQQNLWDECWALYRGLDDWSNREDWQSKIVLPKSFSTVKMATNTVKRLLATSRNPWTIESVNNEDIVNVLRSSQLTELTKYFLEKADFLKEFTDGLESGFIMGLGVWKLWWGLQPRTRTRVETINTPVPYGPGSNPAGSSFLLPNQNFNTYPPPFNQGAYDYGQQNQALYPNQLSGEALNPLGFPTQGGGAPTAPQSYLTQSKQLIREEILEGRLFLRAVDPYNFYWLPGSKLNRWVGTIEEVEIPRYELMAMVDMGIFDKEKIDKIQPMKISERDKQSSLRFNETHSPNNGPSKDTGVVKLTEYFGPLVLDGKLVDPHAHIILANDTCVLVNKTNENLNRKAPYVGFSPLTLPFRTEGVGLIEMVRHIDKAISQLANLSIDTLVFRLLPLFEVALDAFENPEDIETGITPGKLLRKIPAYSGVPAIQPVAMQDISQGTVEIGSQLDRAHHEGALISDVGEGIPRWRGQQTATETQLLQQQSESFMGSMATDIEKGALAPIVEMAMDLIFQYLDTANDPRVGSILGIDASLIAGMSREEVAELISGDYKVKAIGISGQLQKAETLQNLVQIMNLIGQNPQAWLPYVNQDAFLRKVLESFRPQIHDIDNLISDPTTAQAKELALNQQALTPDVLALLPQLMSMQMQQQQQMQQAQQAQQQQALQLQQLAHERAMQEGDLELKRLEIQKARKELAAPAKEE